MLNLDTSSERFFVQNYSGENSEFLNRQKNVFGKLDAVVNDKETSFSKKICNKRNLPNDELEHHHSKKQRYDTRQFRGQESIFKRPEAPPPARFKRNIPDYVRHPQKWTKYTLSDVSQEDMSDRSNTAAAMSFLRELKAKKESELMDVDCEVKQIAFKRPSRMEGTKTTNASKYDLPGFRSSKVIMPEYVVGEKKISKKNTPRLLNKPDKNKEIKLDHLLEDDDCEF